MKREEITTGKVEWPFGREVYVAIYGRAYGVGVGEGTLINVNVLDKPTLSTYEDGPDNVWEKKGPNGEWKKGYDDVTTLLRQVVPKDTKKTGYDWDSEGKVVLTPWVWQQTVGQAVSIRYPFAAQGTFSTSGKWIKDSSTTTQSARKAQGTHGISHKVWCSSCDAQGDDAEAIGGKEAHKEVTCKRSGCGVKYRACNPVAVRKHSKDPDTGKYRCDPLRISLNKTDFMVGEELVVNVEREGLHIANMHMNGTFRTAGYPKLHDRTKTEMRTTFTSEDVGDHNVTISVYYNKGNGCGSTEETYTISVEDAPSVSLNNWTFTTYDTLEVTVSKSDLYYVDFTINGDSVPGQYASGNTSLTLSKGFDYDDVGYHQVAINIYWGENGERSTTHYEYVLISDDR